MDRRAVIAVIGSCVIGILVAIADSFGVGAAVDLASSALPASKSPYVCHVTLPNGSMPPGYDPTPLHYGNGKLWTDLWPAGVVLITPPQVQRDGTLAMKWPWWRALQGLLTVEGRRLDAVAPPLRADIPSDNGYGRFQPSMLLFPSEGCWEVTGKVGNTSLTFVTLVVRSPALAVPATAKVTR